MKINTCSEVISLARELEDKSARFYQDLARKYSDGEEFFLSLVKENKKNVVNIERAYYGVISDAIEGCFAFNLDTDGYAINTALPEKASYTGALKQAIEMEEKIVKFYSEAAEQSRSLMADVPRAFVLVARKRGERIPRLKSLLGK